MGEDIADEQVLQIGQPVMMVMEYCEHGSLQDYLRESGLLACAMCDRIALDAALGLAYLAERGECASKIFAKRATDRYSR